MTSASRPKLFQFGLRTLLLCICLLCVILSRIAYLRQRVIFHEGTAERYAQSIASNQKISRSLVDMIDAKWGEAIALNVRVLSSVEVRSDEDGIVQFARVDEDVRMLHHHRSMAAAYRTAVFRPWTFVNESPANSPLIVER